MHHLSVENESDMIADLSLIHYWIEENLPLNTRFPSVNNRRKINLDKRPMCIHLGVKKLRKTLIPGGCIGNSRYPDLYDMCRDFFDTHFPTHEYNQILINKSNEFQWHQDDNKERGNIIVAFGDYEGGELVVQPKGVNGHLKHTSFDIFLNPIWFDGSQYHKVNKISGERYSITAYLI